MAVKICKIQSTKFTYSGAVFGAVDEETRSLDSFFFGVFVAIFIKALMFIFLQENLKILKLVQILRTSLFLDMRCLGYHFQRGFPPYG